MKKQHLKNLKLNKNLVSNLAKETIVGGTDWPPRENQTGSWCFTGNQTNCQ